MHLADPSRLCPRARTFLYAAAALVLAATLSAEENRPRYVPGRVLIKFAENANADSFLARHTALGLERADRLFPAAPERRARRSQVDSSSEQDRREAVLDRWSAISLRERDVDVEELARALRALPGVEWAEPDYMANIMEGERTPARAPSNRLLKPQTNLVVNDPMFPQQWGLTYINAPAAWDINQGSASQIIAIIDTGIDLDHPDLDDKVYINPRELAGDSNGDNCPGVCGTDDDGDGLTDEGGAAFKNDDDENGYLDDLKGWNFVANTANSQDDNGHGTHAAGVAAAETNNGIGIAGACPLCRVMSLKAFDASGNGASSNIANAITYAWRNGATVISMSFEQAADSQAMRDALNLAYTGDVRTPGTVLVAAAGNKRSSKKKTLCTANTTELPIAPSFPGSYPFVIGVEAGKSDGTLADFSNCQYTVRNPGVGIQSSYFNNAYLSLSGTSMAAPMVAGTAALVRDKNPNWTPGQVFTQLQRSEGDALQALQLGAQPRMEFVDYRITDTCPACNSDGKIQPGETIRVIVTVHNAGSDALGVSGTITSSGPAGIVDGSATWGAVGANADDDNADNPLEITINAGAINNEVINLTLNVTTSNGDGASGFSEAIPLTVTRGIVKSGVLSTNETWTPDNIYLVTDNFLVDTGVTLTIQPGTTVAISSGKSITVRGVLVARGTVSNRITFMVNGTGYWGVINFFGTGPTFDAGNAYVSGSILEYCIVRDSGSRVINGGQVYIARCIFTNIIGDRTMMDISYVEYSLVSGCGTAIFSAGGRVRYNTFVGNGGWGGIETSYGGFFGTAAFNNLFQNTYQDFVLRGSSNVNIPSNYWGTTNASYIATRIEDFFENPGLGVVGIQPVLAAPSPLAPVVVTNISLSPASPIGAQRVTFTVTFSRPMDMTTTPILTFGPQSPYNQKRATLAAQWIDSTQWKVDYIVNKTTGDGNHKISVTGAKDTEGFPLPTGDYRFGFEIITSGTSSAQLTATGLAGAVNLVWNAADPVVYPTLAGYSVYRGSLSAGPFTKINGALIADTNYSDSTALPGVNYYYVYRIVDSDNAESANSDVAPGAALDNVPPVITHTPITTAPAGQIMTVQATMTDNISVTAGRLFHRTRLSSDPYTQLAMINASGSTWSVNVPASALVAPGVEYYLETTDNVSTVQHGSAASPHPVTVIDRPTITSLNVTQGAHTGNTSVTITGTNFQSGAQVTFGGVAATNETVVNSQTLTCSTGAHYPGVVDVTVTNPNTAFGTLTRGFTYNGTPTTLQLPTVNADRLSTTAIAISTPGVDGAISGTFQVTYNAAHLALQSVNVGSLNPAWSVVSNTSTPGTVRISLAGSLPVTGAGSLAIMNFTVNANPGTVTPLTWSQATLNDAVIPITTANGQLTVNNSFNVSGSVTYYNAARPIPSVTMTLDGASSFSQPSATNGTYAINGSPSDTYTLSGSKTDGVVAGSISALDASLVLQHDAGLITLSANQQIAANVNGSPAVNAEDASVLLQYAAGLVTTPFPGSGAVWKFDPPTRNFSPLLSHQTGQNFTALLVGDPTGNWDPAPAAMAPMIDAAPGSVSMSIGSVATCGTTATVPVTLTAIEAGTNLHAIELRIVYDPARMSIAAIRRGPVTTAAGWMIASNTNQAGVIKVAMAGATGVTTTGGILEIDVTGIVSGGGSMSLSSHLLEEGQITASVTNGWVGSCVGGDVNGDGAATPRDLFVLIQRVTSGGSTAGNPDIDKNGIINSADVSYLADYLYGTGPTPQP